MKNKKLFIIVILFLICLLFILILVKVLQSGQTNSVFLVEYSFNGLNYKFVAPDDWILFDVTDTAELHNDIEKFLIIEGGQTNYPRLKIYEFEEEDLHDGNFDKQTIIDMDIERIKEQYEIQSLEIRDNNNIEEISFEFLTKSILFLKRDRLIYCKDWVGKEEGKIFIISICATEQQWEKLDNVYSQIIQSIEFED